MDLNADSEQIAKPKPPRRLKRWVKWGLGGVVVVVAAGAYWGSRVVNSVGGIGGIHQLLTDPKSSFDKHHLTILIAGKDYNHDPRTGNEFTKGSRSDTIMLLSADLDSATLTAVGIPRDTRVTAADGKTGKINAAFSRGGIQLLQQTISQTFGVQPDYYVVLKPDAVKSIVDAIGGVEVTAMDRMHYDDAWDHLHIDLPAGTYRINGEQAAGFVRFRKSGTHTNDPHTMAVIPYPYVPSKEEGDLRRMARQQQLIHAMLSEVVRPANLFHLSSIIDTAFNQVETNLSREQLLSLANIFKNSSHAGLEGASLPGKEGKVDGLDYWIADIDRSKLMLNWILNGDSSAGRKLTRVVVYGIRPEARDDAKRLKDAGFTVTSARPRTTVNDSEVVYRSAQFEGMAHDVANQLGIANVRKDPGNPTAYWLPDVRVTLVPSATSANAAFSSHGATPPGEG